MSERIPQASSVTRLRLVPADLAGPPTWEQAWEEFAGDLELRGLSRHTIEWYQYVVHPFAEHLEKKPGPGSLYVATENDVRAFLRAMSKRVQPRRLNHYREGIKRFYDWLQERGYVEHNPAANIPKMREPRRIVRSLTPEQRQMIVRQPDRTRFVGFRDYCFILLLLDTGLRLSEALQLTVADVTDNCGVVTVMGKGAKERRVSLSPVLVSQLKPYLGAREAALAVIDRADSPWLFPNDTGGKLSPRSARLRLRQYADAAGIPRRVRVSPHTLRHTYALHWVQNDGDLFTLQKTLGHSKLETTRRYVELSDADVLAAQRRLSPLMTMDLPTRGSRIPRGPKREKPQREETRG